MALANPLPGGPRTAAVIKTEEKGSDVNLASYLLVDAFTRDCEAAAVVTNDSDLAEPLALARKRFGLTTGLLQPIRKGRHPSRQLRADFYRRSAPARSPTASSPTFCTTPAAPSIARGAGSGPETAEGRRVGGPRTRPANRPGVYQHLIGIGRNPLSRTIQGLIPIGTRRRDEGRHLPPHCQAVERKAVSTAPRAARFVSRVGFTSAGRTPRRRTRESACRRSPT
jgi:hypothetical protein